jgi:replicative DNA helicase
MDKTDQKSKKNAKKTAKTFINMAEVLNGQKKSNTLPFLKELEEKQESFQEQKHDEICVTGIQTHFIDLDKMIKGLENSQLIILGSRPAMGKTALALNIAENICFKQGLSVGIFSLEMSAEQLSHRMLCSLAEVESEKIKTGELNGVEFQRLALANNTIQKSTLLIDDNPGGLSITDIRERAHQMKSQFNIQMIIIDYLQLITTSAPYLPCENRAHDLSEITRILKYLSKELDIPVICLSQLSRKVEERPGHRPMMSDIRDCGAIEDHADIIMFLLRREYYDPNDKPGMAELIIAKNRHGAVGCINMMYRKELAQFINYTPVRIHRELHPDF